MREVLEEIKRLKGVKKKISKFRKKVKGEIKKEGNKYKQENGRIEETSEGGRNRETR